MGIFTVLDLAAWERATSVIGAGALLAVLFVLYQCVKVTGCLIICIPRCFDLERLSSKEF